MGEISRPSLFFRQTLTNFSVKLFLETSFAYIFRIIEALFAYVRRSTHEVRLQLMIYDDASRQKSDKNWSKIQLHIDHAYFSFSRRVFKSSCRHFKPCHSTSFYVQLKIKKDIHKRARGNPIKILVLKNAWLFLNFSRPICIVPGKGS